MVKTSEQTLTEIRDEVYGGNWRDMLTDLQRRTSLKPYNHKLISRIEADIITIQNILEKYKDKLD